MAVRQLQLDNVVSDAQLAEYNEKGFIVVEAIYSEDDIARMREALDGLIESARGLTEHTSVIDLEPTHTPEKPRVRRIKEPFKNHPVFNEMAHHPSLIQALIRLIGPDLRLHGSKINLKAATFGSPVEWHQDWAFYPHTNDDVLAVGVMLDDMTEENGPLMLISGSHRGPTFDHHQDGRFIGAMDPENCAIDFGTAESVTGKAGDCSFHHVRAVHGSGENTSGKDRRLLLFQIAAADAWDIRGNRDGTWDDYVATMIAGKVSVEPRLVPTPIRLPYPGPLKSGSIYESQSLVKNKYFGNKQ